MKYFCLIIILFSVKSLELHAQTIREQYAAFRKGARQEYADFRKRVNWEYADFMRRAWIYYQALPEVPKPKDETPSPLIIYLEKGENKQSISYPLNEEMTPLDRTIPQPKPIVPIKEIESSKDTHFTYSFWGTECRVRLGDEHRFGLKDCGTSTLADAWLRLSGEEYNNVVRDCLELRIRLHLCDWAYLLMLRDLSSAFLGKETNESVLLLAYLYSQSGYKMKLAEVGGHLYLLFGSRHIIYDMNYWEIEDENYYPLDCKETSLNVCQASFPNEQPLSLVIQEEPLFAVEATSLRTLQSKAFPALKVEVSSNKNLLNFMSTYPSSMLGEDFGTRWAFYANTPLSKQTKSELYPVLQNIMKGKSQKDAANILLNFVQTAFVYEYDDKVWGADRTFFADETLYYPYCDCEDRSILYTRLVRDLLQLKTALIYYPGHLATAVCFTENVEGDYVPLDGVRYVICDPTYINAPIGVAMPSMDSSQAKIILLH